MYLFIFLFFIQEKNRRVLNFLFLSKPINIRSVILPTFSGILLILLNRSCRVRIFSSRLMVAALATISIDHLVLLIVSLMRKDRTLYVETFNDFIELQNA